MPSRCIAIRLRSRQRIKSSKTVWSKDPLANMSTYIYVYVSECMLESSQYTYPSRIAYA